MSLSMTWFNSGQWSVPQLLQSCLEGLTQDLKDFFQITHLSPALNQGSDRLIRPFDRLGYLINILWFDDSFEVIL
jgi:hypothetical protein